MLSVTGEYALRAMVYLAKNATGSPVPGPRIAEAAGVPRRYLSAILADLVRCGLLEGTRGKSGGFQFTRPIRTISLSQIVSPFEPASASRKTCPFSDRLCSDNDPCSAHERWKEVNAALRRFLEETTLEDVAIKASDGAKLGRSKRSA